MHPQHKRRLVVLYLAIIASLAAALYAAGHAEARTRIGISDDGAMLAPGGIAWAHQQGVRDIRFMVRRGQENRYDQAVQNADRYGLRILVVVVDTPDDQSAAHARDIAQRWPQVDAISVGNEVNYRIGACAYNDIYRATRTAVRAVSDVPVLWGELAPNGAEISPERAAMEYLRDATRCGGQPLRADGVAVHPYQFSDPLSPGRSDWLGIGRTPRLKRWLTHNKRARQTFRRSLWLTEFGYPRHHQADQAQAEHWWPRAKTVARRVKARTLVAQGAVTTGRDRNWDSSMANGLLATLARS